MRPKQILSEYFKAKEEPRIKQTSKKRRNETLRVVVILIPFQQNTGKIKKENPLADVSFQNKSLPLPMTSHTPGHSDRSDIQRTKMTPETESSGNPGSSVEFCFVPFSLFF